MGIEDSEGIIPDSGLDRKSREAGGILHLPVALRLYPTKRLILYNRTSGYGKQVGHGRSNLEEKERVLYRAVRQLTEDRPLRKIVSVAGEPGKLSARRPGLIDAAEEARKLNAMLVAYDLSRFLRPEAYDPRKNPHAEPTADEIRLLHEMTFGVVLATVLPPWLSESQRHSYLTKRTGKAGRPRKQVSDQRLRQIMDAILMGHSLRDTACSYGVSLGWVQRALKRLSPYRLCGGRIVRIETPGDGSCQNALTWGELLRRHGCLKRSSRNSGGG